MAYNNYPTYPYYPNAYQPPQRVESVGSGIIWVQGEAGAKSYLVAPNSTVQLWDSESRTIYLKSADASGMPSMKVLEYTIKGGEEPVPGVTRADLKALQDQIDEIRKELANE